MNVWELIVINWIVTRLRALTLPSGLFPVRVPKTLLDNRVTKYVCLTAVNLLSWLNKCLPNWSCAHCRVAQGLRLDINFLFMHYLFLLYIFRLSFRLFFLLLLLVSAIIAFLLFLVRSLSDRNRGRERSGNGGQILTAKDRVQRWAVAYRVFIWTTDVNVYCCRWWIFSMLRRLISICLWTGATWWTTTLLLDPSKFIHIPLFYSRWVILITY
jgi:hypothetical protein